MVIRDEEGNPQWRDADGNLHAVHAVLDNKLFQSYWAYEDGELAGWISPEHFPTEPQYGYLTSKKKYVLLWGTRGKGSTEAIIWDAIFTAWAIPGKNQVIFRRTMPELEGTIIERMKSLPEEVRGELVSTPGAKHFLFPNGHRVYLCAIKDDEAAKKYLSREYVKIHIDEWCDFPYVHWRKISGSLRTVAEKDVYGRPIVCQVKGGSNPTGISSDEMNRLFGCEVDKQCVLGDDPNSYNPDQYEAIFAHINSNPALAKGTVQGDAYWEILEAQDSFTKRAWLEGKFGHGEGSYFKTFDKELVEFPHDRGLKLMMEQRWQPCWISIDWASSHNFAVHWHTFLEFEIKQSKEYPQGGIVKVPFTYREWSDKGLSERALAQEIIERTPTDTRRPELDERKRVDAVYLSPDCGFEDPILSRGAKIGDVFVASNMPRARAAYNPRIDGWRLMNGLLSDKFMLTTDEEICGWLVDSSTCPLLIDALPWAQCDPKKDGDVLKLASQLDDILDSGRYGIASRIGPEDKPFDVRLRERLSVLPVEGSARNIARLKMIEEEKKNSEPYVMGNGIFQKGRVLHGARRK